MIYAQNAEKKLHLYGINIERTALKRCDHSVHRWNVVPIHVPYISISDGGVVEMYFGNTMSLFLFNKQRLEACLGMIRVL